ncbi:MAG: DUF3995 domain-containing protein [Actinomycetia bacterium]|nr:DUF3995 domain-containing protein [Actinomycetes bacterium]
MVIAVLHVAWGRGSSVPFRSRSELADAVVGSDSVPPPPACYAVAAALAGAAALLLDVPIAPRPVRRLGRRVAAGVLLVRGVAGASGRTDLLVPGSVSPRFRRLDRRFFAPLCLALAAGAAAAN